MTHSNPESDVIGINGRATRLDIDPELDGAKTTVTWWLLTGTWHPVWPQFVPSVVSLADVEGVPPAHLQFPGATHELLVVALDPGKGQTPRLHSKKTLTKKGFRGVGGFLSPVDVCHQLTATDEEMTQLTALCAKACVDGHLNPSTDDSRERLREHWLTSCVRTLAHMRGEAHAQ